MDEEGGGEAQQLPSPKYRVLIQRRAADSSGLRRAWFRSQPRVGAKRGRREERGAGRASQRSCRGSGEPERTKPGSEGDEQPRIERRVKVG